MNFFSEKFIQRVKNISILDKIWGIIYAQTLLKHVSNLSNSLNVIYSTKRNVDIK